MNSTIHQLLVSLSRLKEDRVTVSEDIYRLLPEELCSEPTYLEGQEGMSSPIFCKIDRKEAIKFLKLRYGFLQPGERISL